MVTHHCMMIPTTSCTGLWPHVRPTSLFLLTSRTKPDYFQSSILLVRRTMYFPTFLCTRLLLQTAPVGTRVYHPLESYAYSITICSYQLAPRSFQDQRLSFLMGPYAKRQLPQPLSSGNAIFSAIWGLPHLWWVKCRFDPQATQDTPFGPNTERGVILLPSAGRYAP